MAGVITVKSARDVRWNLTRRRRTTPRARTTRSFYLSLCL